MPLTHTRELFAKALKGKYAIGAFNVNNMELLQAIVEACEEEKAPLMLQISKGARQYANPVYLKKLIEADVARQARLREDLRADLSGLGSGVEGAPGRVPTPVGDGDGGAKQLREAGIPLIEEPAAA